MTYLLDTNVLSELVKARRNPGLLNWMAGTDPNRHHVSVMSIGEIRRGIHRLYLRRDLTQAGRLESWLDETVVAYRDRIVPVDAGIAQCWGRNATTRPGSTVDGLIGATAEVNGLTVITRNVKDFTPLGVEVVNPFTEEER